MKEDYRERYPWLEKGEATIEFTKHENGWISQRWIGPRNGRVTIGRHYWNNVEPYFRRVMDSMYRVVDDNPWSLSDSVVIMRRRVSFWPLFWLGYRIKRSEDWLIARRIFWLWMKRFRLAERSEAEYPHFKRWRKKP